MKDPMSRFGKGPGMDFMSSANFINDMLSGPSLLDLPGRPLHGPGLLGIPNAPMPKFEQRNLMDPKDTTNYLNNLKIGFTSSSGMERVNELIGGPKLDLNPKPSFTPYPEPIKLSKPEITLPLLRPEPPVVPYTPPLVLPEPIHLPNPLLGLEPIDPSPPLPQEFLMTLPKLKFKKVGFDL